MALLRAGALCSALLALAVPARGDVPVPPPAASAGDQGLVSRSPLAPLGDPSLNKKPAPDVAQAWSCTLRSLAQGRPCVLEGERTSTRAAPRRRDAEVLSIRDALCAQTAPADARSLCELIIDTGAASCGAARTASLLDQQGRFRPDAGTCVSDLRDALVTLGSLLNDHAACCACLQRVAPAPGASVGQCLEGVAVGTPPDGLGQQRQCDEACAALLLRQPAPAARPAPTTTQVTP